MSEPWVELMYQCDCGIWCENISYKVYHEKLIPEWSALEGSSVHIFRGNSVAESLNARRQAGWQKIITPPPYSNVLWWCPTCVQNSKRENLL